MKLLKWERNLVYQQVYEREVNFFLQYEYFLKNNYYFWYVEIYRSTEEKPQKRGFFIYFMYIKDNRQFIYIAYIA